MTFLSFSVHAYVGPGVGLNAIGYLVVIILGAGYILRSLIYVPILYLLKKNKIEEHQITHQHDVNQDMHQRKPK